MTDVDAELAELATCAHILSRVLRRTGEQDVGLPPLPASEFEVLQHVGSHPDSSVSDVARALRLQTSNVSTTVRALVGRGLVSRVPDPTDQRRSLLRISDEATHHRARLEDTWARMLAAALVDLSPDEQAAIRAATPALARLTQAVVGGPPAARSRSGHSGHSRHGGDAGHPEDERGRDRS